jgi:predicted nucleic acid-binding protein
MIILDTNIISEIIRPTPAQEVKHWLLERTEEEPLTTTVITIMEIEYGLARLPEGTRRRELEERFATLTGRQFEFAVLPLDEKAARLAGKLRARRESMGLHAQSADMMIAAIALIEGASLATLNIKDFTETGLVLINPWGGVN